MNSRERDLARIRDALHAASKALQRHLGAPIEYTIKHGHGPVTAADHELDALLRTTLPEAGEGWLSEETVDDAARLSCRRVWIVDPIDGTRSLVAGRPEYSISIALVEDGEPVLGGVCNPASGVTVVGGPEVGLTVEGDPKLSFPGRGCSGALRVLASRSECRSGECRSVRSPTNSRWSPPASPTRRGPCGPRANGMSPRAWRWCARAAAPCGLRAALCRSSIVRSHAFLGSAARARVVSIVSELCWRTESRRCQGLSA
jgi:hypothetical protein